MMKFPVANRALRISLGVVALAAACTERSPMAPDDPGVVAAGTLANNHEAAFTSGSAGITTYDPIHAAVFDPAWETTVCTPTPAIGPSAAWLNPHAPLFIGHPWAGVGGTLFDAPWINAWDGGSVGPGGHNWSKYSMSVSGTGQHVVQLLADNCSWVYLDNALVAIQPVSHGGTWGTYPLELGGTQQLTFIIFDGGGAAGGKFRLETRQSWITHGGDPALLPPPIQPPSVTPASICALVRQYVSQHGIANSMCKQLENGAYGAFRNHVKAQSGKSLTAANAATLISLSLQL